MTLSESKVYIQTYKKIYICNGTNETETTKGYIWIREKFTDKMETNNNVRIFELNKKFTYNIQTNVNSCSLRKGTSIVLLKT